MGGLIIGKVDVKAVRNAVYRAIGSRVVVKANRGRHRFDVNEGVIKEVYPHVFMIQINDSEEDAGKTVSYTYTDILTKDVQLQLCTQ